MQTKINVKLPRSFSLISRYIIKNLDQSRLYNFFKFKKKKNNKLDLFSDVLKIINKEYVVKDVDQSKVIDAAINGMLQSLDPYSSYISPESFKIINEQDIKGEFGGLGIEITMEKGFVKVISPIQDSPADRVGIKSCDYIIKINDKQVNSILEDNVNLLRGKVGTSIKITIRREGVYDDLSFTIIRDIIKVGKVTSTIKEEVGYIKITGFNEQSYDELLSEIKDLSNKDLKGYILDLRNNPGGLLLEAVKISDAFLDSGEIVSIRGRNKDDIEIYNAKKGDVLNGKPLVVLVNRGSASASEIVSGALKYHKRATIVGEKTFGKGSVQSLILLKDKGALKLTTAKYYLPCGTSISENGVEPDISVKENKIDFIINDDKKDNQLRYALNFFSKDKNITNIN
jgi:carboxyl-terminal processing protease